jgi:hypothetical protein
MILACVVAEQMAGRGRGVVVNIASQLASCGAEGRGVYAAAKAGRRGGQARASGGGSPGEDVLRDVTSPA